METVGKKFKCNHRCFDNKYKPYRKTILIPEDEIFNKTPEMIEKSESGWYRITLTNVNEYDKEEILLKLKEITTPVPIHAFGWQVQLNKTHFFVNNIVVAKRLARLKGYARMPCGKAIPLTINTKLFIAHITVEHKYLLLNAVAKCYDSGRKMLNLSQFYKNEILMSHFSPLFVPEIMEIVLHIVGSKYKLVRELNISSYNISDLKVLAKYSNVLRNLHTIDLTNNLIRTVNELECLSDFSLKDIKLTDNPVNTNSTRSEIFQKIPMLTHLNGFSILTQQLPPAKQCNLCGTAAKSFMKTFIYNFYLHYDSDRDKLFELYDKNATFTLNIPNDANSLKDVSYNIFNRDMLSDCGSSFALKNKLIHGNLNIMNAFKLLPATKHESDLSYNLMVFATHLREFVVNGIFFETTSTSKIIKRSFNRSFILKPCMSGITSWIISNDKLTITECSQEVDLVQDPRPQPLAITMPNNELLNNFSFSPAQVSEEESQRTLLNEVDETKNEDYLEIHIEDDFLSAITEEESERKLVNEIDDANINEYLEIMIEDDYLDFD